MENKYVFVGHFEKLPDGRTHVACHSAVECPFAAHAGGKSRAIFNQYRPINRSITRLYTRGGQTENSDSGMTGAVKLPTGLPEGEIFQF